MMFPSQAELLTFFTSIRKQTSRGEQIKVEMMVAGEEGPFSEIINPAEDQQIEQMRKELELELSEKGMVVRKRHLCERTI